MIDPNTKSNNKNLWAYIKSKCIDHSGIPSLSHNGITITDSKEKVNVFINHFSSVFTNEDTNSVPTLNDNPYPDIQPINIQASDVYHHLTSLQPHKAPGPDNIPPTLLKIATVVLKYVSLSLTLIFNASINYHMAGSKLMLSLSSKGQQGTAFKLPTNLPPKCCL